MVCGGSGVTPILQVLRGIFDDAEDVETRVWLLNGNRMVADILCREDLDTYLGPHSERYKLHHTLSTPCPPPCRSLSQDQRADSLDPFAPSPPQPSRPRTGHRTTRGAAWTST